MRIMRFDKVGSILSLGLSINLTSEYLRQFRYVSGFLCAKLPAGGSADKLALVESPDHEVVNVPGSGYRFQFAGPMLASPLKLDFHSPNVGQ